jgi:hypothetical protein
MNVGQRAILHLPLDQANWLEDLVVFEEMERSEIYRMDPTNFSPILNVLIVQQQTPDGRVRFEIRAEERVLTAAGINWIGSQFAEIYIHYQEQAFNPNYIRSVLSSVVVNLYEQNRIPLLRVPTNNVILGKTIEEFGFSSTGNLSLIGPIQRV